MKKLLIITDAWYPQVSGMVTVLEKITQLAEQKDISVLIVHPGLCRNVPLPFYKEIRIGLFSRGLIGDILEAERPDYIHIATEGPLGLTAMLLCRKRGLRFTTSYHTHFHLYVKVRLHFFEKLTDVFMRWFHRKDVRTMVATETLKNQLEAKGFKNIVLWPLGVDTDLFTNETPSSLPALPGPVFLYFGRLAPEKNVEDFLRLNLPGTKLIIGDGPDRKSLEARYGDSAIFVGYKKGRELVDWLLLSDVMVFPSVTETFGLVALEVLACGIPVAAHDVMGPSDIITHGVDGFLDADLEKAALECLKLNRSRCREKALQYSWKTSLEAFISHLEPATHVTGSAWRNFAAKFLKGKEL